MPVELYVDKMNIQIQIQMAFKTVSTLLKDPSMKKLIFLFGRRYVSISQGACLMCFEIL